MSLTFQLLGMIFFFIKELISGKSRISVAIKSNKLITAVVAFTVLSVILVYYVTEQAKQQAIENYALKQQIFQLKVQLSKRAVVTSPKMVKVEVPVPVANATCVPTVVTKTQKVYAVKRVYVDKPTRKSVTYTSKPVVRSTPKEPSYDLKTHLGEVP